MLFKEAVSKRIFELCDEYNYTPNKLAELSTVPLSTLLTNQVTNPSSYVIYKICKTLKIEMKDFFNSELFNYKKLDD